MKMGAKRNFHTCCKTLQAIREDVPFYSWNDLREKRTSANRGFFLSGTPMSREDDRLRHREHAKYYESVLINSAYLLELSRNNEQTSISLVNADYSRDWFFNPTFRVHEHCIFFYDFYQEPCDFEGNRLWQLMTEKTMRSAIIRVPLKNMYLSKAADVALYLKFVSSHIAKANISYIIKYFITIIVPRASLPCSFLLLFTRCVSVPLIDSPGRNVPHEFCFCCDSGYNSDDKEGRDDVFVTSQLINLYVFL